MDTVDTVKTDIDLALAEFNDSVDRGMRGENVGLRIANPVVHKWTNGLHRRRNYLFGADSGVGKTTEVDDILLDAWEDAKSKGLEFKSIYYSFEISRTEKIGKWVARWIYKNYGLPMDSDYILGRKEGKLLTPEDRGLISEALLWVKEVLKDIIIIDVVKHPTAIFNDIVDYMERHHGKVERVKGKDDRMYICKFIPKNPMLYFFVVVDHLALTHEEAGLDTKKTMDRLSKYSVTLRNIFGISCLFVQQFNTDLQSTNRQSKMRGTGESAFTPQRLDFGDSRYTYRDADVVFGLIKPQKFDLQEFMGYDLTPQGDGPALGDYLVPLFLMKNRYGVEDKVAHQILIGPSACFYPAPPADNPLAIEKLNEELREIEKQCQRYQPHQ